MVILTALLVTGAFLAYRQLNQQIQQSEVHHKEQLRASLRPLVVIQEIAVRHLQGLADAYGVQVAIQNVGSGPALEVEVRAWARVVDPWPDEAERRAKVDQLRGEVDIDQPELTLRVGGIAAGDPARPLPLPGDGGVVQIEGSFITRGILLYIVLYKDVFDNQFPSAPRSIWRVGHQTVTEKN